jgi:hypothetical protein
MPVTPLSKTAKVKARLELLAAERKAKEASAPKDTSLFATNRTKEQARFELLTETNYYSVLCFETQAQRDEFFSVMADRGLAIGPGGNRIVDGLAVAQSIGVELKSPRAVWPQESAERRRVRELQSG